MKRFLFPSVVLASLVGWIVWGCAGQKAHPPMTTPRIAKKPMGMGFTSQDTGPFVIHRRASQASVGEAAPPGEYGPIDESVTTKFIEISSGAQEELGFEWIVLPQESQ